MPIEKELDCIEHSGGLFTDEIIHSLRKEEPTIEEVEPRSFSFNGFEPETQTDLDRAIGQSWETLKEKWDKFYREKSGTIEELSVSDTRKLWISPLFRQLGYQPEWIQSSLERGGKSFNLAHRGWDSEEAPILHSVRPGQSLDDKPSDAGRGARSPHDLVQEFLNLDQSHLWAILTNGLRIRLIRDFYHEVTKGYLEIDLENIFESRRYDDFRALYRLFHASRFLSGEDTKIRVETIHEKSRTSGITVGKELRGNVRDAIEFLANGLLNVEQLDSYKESTEKCEEFYEEVLTVIYRVLFLLFAEQRGMVPSQDLLEEHSGLSTGERSLYSREYSITSLRERAEQGPGSIKHSDLWEGLQVTFDMFKEGRKELGIFPYNGALFDTDNTPRINDLSCPNEYLLKAIRSLTLVERDGILQRINYARIGVEEIGAIYENLLDFQPLVPKEDEEVDGEILKANTFCLDPRGSKRKGTGSYYTRPSLVNQLIETGLEPVIEDRLEEKENKEEREKALLDIKVCDPACGSAAFLIRANNVLAQKLAQVRMDGGYPSDNDIMEARREVLRHCIYGVDLNPMAVELAKVSLWINATVQDKPLNFLNHRIKVGNSLIGTVPGSIERGITQETFSLQYIPEDDNREIVKELRKRVRNENKEGMKALDLRKTDEVDKLGSEDMEELGEIPEESAEDIAFKQDFYSDFVEDEQYLRKKFIHDLWTAAYFWENKRKWDWYPTSANFEKTLSEPKSVPSREREEINRLAEENKFFHWHLAFPEVFSDDKGGFDCVLGNPPWGKVEFQEKKYFQGRNESIVNARNKSKRLEKIEDLEETNPELYQDYKSAKRSTDCQSKFMRASGRFEFTGQGKLNTYAVFSELDRDLISSSGSAGVIIPSGLATDKTTSDFFRNLMENSQIKSMYDFENREGLFPEVHRSYKFSLLTLRGKSVDLEEADFAYFMTNLDQLAEDERHFSLSSEEIKLLNPNTRTSPVFRGKKDAELTKKLYKQAPVLINEETGKNPWGVDFQQGLFNMSSDSHLFKTKEEIESEGYELEGNHFVKNGQRYLPLYEAKMFWHYNHRFGTYENYDDSSSSTNLQTPSEEKLQDLDFSILPRYWVKEKNVKERLDLNYSYFLTFRNITNSTNERTVVLSVIPLVGVGHSAPLMFVHNNQNDKLNLCFVANFDSFVFDFIVRQKLGGTNLTYFIIKQLPVLTPNQYSSEQKDFIIPRVVELTYTANDMKRFAEDIIENIETKKWNKWFPNKEVKTDGNLPDPFIWDEKRRFKLRCELDAMYAHLYNVTKAELDYILETFPIVKRQDIEEHGTYVTKNRILKEYEKLS